MDKIDKIHETQEKAEHNKKHQGKGSPQKSYPISSTVLINNPSRNHGLRSWSYIW